MKSKKAYLKEKQFVLQLVNGSCVITKSSHQHAVDLFKAILSMDIFYAKTDYGAETWVNSSHVVSIQEKVPEKKD